MAGKLCHRGVVSEEQRVFRRCQFILSLTLIPALLLPSYLQAADTRHNGNDPFIIQQQRQEALEQQLTPSAPDVRLSAPGSFARKINFPVETPCFQIKQTELEGLMRYHTGCLYKKSPTGRSGIAWGRKELIC